MAQQDHINVGTVNVNSLTNKTTFVHGLIENHDLDILGICETWLVSSMASSFVDLPGYVFCRGDVAGDVRKHGAGIYVRESFHPVEVGVTLHNVVAVEIPRLACHIICCYRPPSYSEDENTALRNFIEEFCVGKTVIVLGDFNLPSLVWNEDGMTSGGESLADRLFLESFLLSGLRQWVCEGTFFPSGNMLDLFLTSDHDVVGDVSVLPPLPGCHHCPIVAQVFPYTLGCAEPDERTSRLWFKGNYGAINESLLRVDWDSEFEGGNVDQMYERFLEILGPIVEEFVPERLYDPKRLEWAADPPRSMKRNRATAWDEYKMTRREYGRNHEASINALARYNALNYEFRNYGRRRQWQYEFDLAERLSDNPKLFHSYVRRRKKGKPIVGPLKVDGQVTADAAAMAEVLGECFSSIYNDSTPQGLANHQQATGVAMEPLEISYDAVIAALQDFKSSSSPGPDRVHPFLLKSCVAILGYPLTLIVLKSLEERSVPSEWRKSIVIPLHKGGTRSVPLNYRPVSLTSMCCKAMEKILASHIVEYMETNHLFSPEQFGFRKERGTEDQLLLFYGEVAKYVDEGKSVDVVYVDLSKAFDVLNHEVLLEKLRSLQFCEQIVAWIGSFLQERTMRVSISGKLSAPRDVTSGVPQGSVLGPILFLIYVNSLMAGAECSWKAFADDFKLSACVPSQAHLDSTGSALQRDLNRLFQACGTHNLVLNNTKTVVMRFGDKVDAPRPLYSLGGSELVVVKSYKDLGVVVDDKLRFHGHVRKIVNSAGGLISELLRSTVCRDPKFMVQLFASHIRPIIDYCSCLWNVGWRGDKTLLESLQRRWTRQIHGLSHHAYEDRLKESGLYSVSGRLARLDLIKVWKAFSGNEQVNLDRLFQRARYEGTRGHGLKLSMPRSSTELGRRLLGSRCVFPWNALPADVVESDSLNAFKRKLDAELGESLYQG